MMTVKEISKITGISIRTLHYYDQIGLLKPTEITDAGYRLYNDESLERLQQILLYRELEFSLKDIKKIIESSDFDKTKILEQQIELLTMKKEHLENIINFALGVKMLGVRAVDFSVFDARKIDEYTKQVKENWGQTDAYREFEEKQKKRTPDDERMLSGQIMGIFAEFGKITDLNPSSAEVQNSVEKLRQFITDNFYECTPQIFRSLAKMYSCGGNITENINKAGGSGTAELVSHAIEIYCDNLK